VRPQADVAARGDRMVEREIGFEQVWNFRDIGGYSGSDDRSIQQRLIFRSMSPEWMTDADVERARAELHISTIVDLRGAGQTSGALGLPPTSRIPIDLLADLQTSQVPRPTATDGSMMLRWLLKAAATGVVEAVEALAAAEGPRLFHCSMGNNRTGIVAAVILGLAGVSDDDIIEDFMKSGDDFPRMLRHLDSVGRAIGAGGDQPPSEAPMRAGLEFIHREFGGFREYLLANGASDGALDGLTEDLVA
jgi:protein-tyrosine phosphatase